MTQPEALGNTSGGEEPGSGDLASAEGRDRGARRRKLAGYLKAANEIRQSYQQSYTDRYKKDAGPDEESHGIPGAFPDVSVVRSGDEEMVLFPSYARRHIKREKPHVSSQGAEISKDDEGGGSQTAQDAEYWRKEWEKYEDDKAVVDVDVRGWIYSPHRGPMTRKNRLLIGLARQLSGIPAPPTMADEAEHAAGAGQGGRATHEERVNSRAARHEEELVKKEAESILRKGEDEADIAGRGGYSEEPRAASDGSSIHSTNSRSGSPDSLRPRRPPVGHGSHPLSQTSLVSDWDSSPDIKPLQSRTSWNQPADMNAEQLAEANAHLMARLKPFLTNPVAASPVTVFFYDDSTSQSKTVVTNEAGHFSLRAALDFVPTNIRVLASDSLSATTEIRVSEPQGVSLISDIDDTVKHSAVGSGAKEIFRNAFIRDLADLTIEGVREWYSRMVDIGVKLHYVSNSPWQLYPVLASYFALAGLPSGSFHLKQYSGMLQGIFEPVAERKKGTLTRIMQDFPERKFILVGDSGEADLEVYTDVVLANPGKILGIYIRDITTPAGKPIIGTTENPSDGGDSADVSDLQSQALTEETESRPALPPRRSAPDTVASSESTGPKVGKLIDFDEDPPSEPSSKSDLQEVGPSSYTASRLQSATSSPVRPAKPARFRSEVVGNTTSKDELDDISNLSTSPSGRPPLPPKPRGYSNWKPGDSPPSRLISKQTTTSQESKSKEGYIPAVSQTVASAYNKVPAASSLLRGFPGTDRARPSSSGSESTTTSGSTALPAPALQVAGGSSAPPMSRRAYLASYPAAAAQYASRQINARWSGVDGAADPDNPNLPINKKLELWNRRWARAKATLDKEGVQLRSWRVGTDVIDDAVQLVRNALGDTQR